MRQYQPADFQIGEILLIDKPLDWTSFDVVNKIRILLRKELNIQRIKVGHSGTLDPLATGLLIVCTGKATKKLMNLQGLEKEYTGTLTLGATTPSFDLETEIDKRFEIIDITDEKVRQTAKKFTGIIKQVPPVFSAKKIDGEPVYKKARKNEKISMTPVKVVINEFEITGIDLPLVRFRVVCGTGAYIRSLAHDFGKALNNGAYLSSLCRTRIGSFKLVNAMSVQDVAKLLNGIREQNILNQ